MKSVEAVIVGYLPWEKKWPDSSDTDYNSVLGKRDSIEYNVDGETVKVIVRWYPVFRAYAMAGVSPPLHHPYINNSINPPQSVMDAMHYDLMCIANDGCKLLFWEHAYQCYPPVAQFLKGMFAHSVLIHCDDAPGSTEIKTLPIARFFDSAIVGNIIWNASGEKTKDLYRRMGINDTHYLALSTTGGFMEGLAEQIGLPKKAEEGIGIAPLRHGFGGARTGYAGVGEKPGIDLDRRIDQIRRGAYSNDVVFVGGCMGPHRAKFNTAESAACLASAGIRNRILGIGMRDGPLMPRDPATLGRTVAKLYLDSFAALNIQFIGLMGTRPFDAWASGTLLVQWDPVGELADLGVVAGIHYAAYDGTIPGLISTIRYYQSHLDETEEILRSGYEISLVLPKENSIPRATERILSANKSKWGWS